MECSSKTDPLYGIGKKTYAYECIFSSQFNYCSVIWICHSLALNNKINRLHERCLRLLYNNKISTFKELLEKDNAVSIHNRKIQEPTLYT